jgi:type I restriction enzyme S subunit
MTGDLPPGWSWATLGDLGVEIRGQLTPVPGATYDLYSVPTFPMGRPERIDGVQVKSGKRGVQPRDVLLCKINPRINRVWVVGRTEGYPQIASTEYLVLRPHEPRMAPFIQQYLSSPRFRDWIRLSVEGATGSHTRAKSGPILNQAVPVAPLAEQERIVAAIEEHFSRLDAADKSMAAPLPRAAQLLERALQAELQSAKLLNQPLHRFLTEPLSNGRSVPTAEKHGFPVLRLTCLKDGRVDTSECKQGNYGEVDSRRFQVEPNDFLISRGNGSLHLVGIGGLVPRDGRPVAYPDTLIRARVDGTRLRPAFLSLVWNSRTIRRQLESQARTTAGIYKVNQAMIADVTLPAPSLEVQDRVVERLDLLRQMISQLDSDVDRYHVQSASLRRSILAAAFSGRLVPQDPDEEPASVLLERIAASRAADPLRRRSGAG